MAFHVHDNYVTQHGRRFGARRRVADEQRLGTEVKRLRATVAPTFHTHWGEVTKFENAERPRVRRTILIDYKNGQHTYLSVC